MDKLDRNPTWPGNVKAWKLAERRFKKTKDRRPDPKEEKKLPWEDNKYSWDVGHDIPRPSTVVIKSFIPTKNKNKNREQLQDNGLPPLRLSKKKAKPIVRSNERPSRGIIEAMEESMRAGKPK